uniref:Zgc:153383 n=1 Tax=Neogobius melanostomus TaxID=47308 RepID=A0A8C6U7P2_9GOBI
TAESVFPSPLNVNDAFPVRDFESVELGELERAEDSAGHKEKLPRRIIHFSSGETMEEYSTDEERRRKRLRGKTCCPRPAATSTISACDYLGERMANLFGITSAKYQYAIDEYYRIKKEREEEQEESRLSEVAERTFDQTEEEEEEEEDAPAPASRRGTVLLPTWAFRSKRESNSLKYD